MLMKFVIASLVGAVIGYITNWLAIKMLFRPHEEKRFLGFKVPFTPGLIPKERYRMAKSVGETVGTHLLSRETLVDALCSPKVKGQLDNRIETRIKEIKNSESTIEEKLKLIAGDKYEDVLKTVNSYIANRIVAGVREPETQDKFTELIGGALRNHLEVNPGILLQSQQFMNIKDKMAGKIENLKDSPFLKEKLEEYIIGKLEDIKEENRTIEEVVPESLIASIKVYIYNSREEICDTIGEMLKQEDIQERIKSVISSMIGSNLNPLVAMFLNVDTIYGKLIGAFEQYLKEDENQRNTAMLINKGIDRIIKSSVNEALERIDEGDRDRNIKAFSEFILNNILNREFINNALENVEEFIRKYSSIHEILVDLDENYMNKINNLIQSQMEKILTGSAVEESINTMVEKGTGEVLKLSLSSIMENKEEKITDIATKLASNIYQRFIDNEAADVVENLNISEIVEERINSFDVNFAEKIILDISSKELSAITWLGALLGGIIGILSPILNMLY
jgi:uncharacterized membrane protein YheB (UPF0754 family)